LAKTAVNFIDHEKYKRRLDVFVCGGDIEQVYDSIIDCATAASVKTDTLPTPVSNTSPTSLSKRHSIQFCPQRYKVEM